MAGSSVRPEWEDLPQSERDRYTELGLGRTWYESGQSATSRGDISMPVVGVRSDTGARGFYRLTSLSARDASLLGEQAVRVKDYLAFNREPSSALDGMVVEGVDAETGKPIRVTLTSDITLLAVLQFTGELRYENFYQRISR